MAKVSRICFSSS